MRKLSATPNFRVFQPRWRENVGAVRDPEGTSYRELHRRRALERPAVGESCRRMSNRGSGLAVVLRVVSFGRAQARNAASTRVYHTPTGQDDKSPLSLRLISYCSERGTRTSTFPARNLLVTLAPNRLPFRRYCCKKDSDDEDEMSAAKRDSASEQLNHYRSTLKVHQQRTIKFLVCLFVFLCFGG